jgi:hypothetical protein
VWLVTDQQPLQFDVDPIEAAFGQMAGPVHLPSLGLQERGRTLVELRAWVRTLVQRFGIEPRVLPPCWEQHNGMVEALLALRDHERACYADSASPTAAVDWFRALREVEIRLADLAAQTQCTIHEHRPTPVQEWAIDSSIETAAYEEDCDD